MAGGHARNDRAMELTNIAVVAHVPAPRPSPASGGCGTISTVSTGGTGGTSGTGGTVAVPHHHRDGIPAAVAEPVFDLVSGPLRPATVLAVHSAAVILACDGPGPGGDAVVTRVVTVLAAEGSGVPHGVRTALHAADRPFGRLSPGDAAFVGALGIRLPDLRLRAVRTVRTAVPLVQPSPTAVTAIAYAARSARRGVPDRAVRALAEALAAHSAARLRAAVTALVGLGSGSTPGGDDVLCGVLAGLHATGRAGLAEQIAIAALHGVATRTPLVSADLLRLAAGGNACAEAIAVLRACDGRSAAVSRTVSRTVSRAASGAVTPAPSPAPTRAPSPAPFAALARALDRLLAIGHTSGADLATGLAMGLGIPPRPAPSATPSVSRPSTGGGADGGDGRGSPRRTPRARRGTPVGALTPSAREEFWRTDD